MIYVHKYTYTRINANKDRYYKSLYASTLHSILYIYKKIFKYENIQTQVLVDLSKVMVLINIK